MYSREGWRIVFVISAGFLASACASTQLNYNTLELASTVGDLQTRQVLHNLSLFIDNPGAIPAHVDLAAGSASTSNSISPTVTTPITAAAAGLSQVTNTFSGNPSTVAEVQNTATRAGSGLSLAAQDLWSQSWNYDPVIDGEALRRLRSLYKYALGKISDEGLKQEYPLVQKPQTVVYSGGTVDGGKAAQIYNDSVYCPDVGLATVSMAEDFNRNPQAVITPARCSTISTQIQIPDEHYLHEPSCILCLPNRGVITRRSKLTVNRRLQELHGRWLLSEADNPSSDCCLFLGHYGKHDLWITKDDQPKLSEFTLFILTATAESSAAAAAAGSASGTQKRPANTPQAFIPVGGGGAAVPFFGIRPPPP